MKALMDVVHDARRSKSASQYYTSKISMMKFYTSRTHEKRVYLNVKLVGQPSKSYIFTRNNITNSLFPFIRQKFAKLNRLVDFT